MGKRSGLTTWTSWKLCKFGPKKQLTLSSLAKSGDSLRTHKYFNKLRKTLTTFPKLSGSPAEGVSRSLWSDLPQAEVENGLRDDIGLKSAKRVHFLNILMTREKTKTKDMQNSNFDCHLHYIERTKTSYWVLDIKANLAMFW